MLIDAHAHLDRYGELLEDALQQIRRNRIFVIGNSMDVPSYKQNLAISDRCDLVLPTFGVHPKLAPKYADHLHDLAPEIERTPAIGEIGLDFHWVNDSSQYPAQEKVLRFFLAAAREQNKIVNLHTKGGEKKILTLLERYDIQRAIVHWYSGPLDIFRALAEYGVFFTVGVEVLYSQHIQAITRELPTDRLLTETDNPGGLKWLRGTSGMPLVLRQVVRAIADIRRTTPGAIEKTVQENFCRLITGDPWLLAIRRRIFPNLVEIPSKCGYKTTIDREGRK